MQFAKVNPHSFPRGQMHTVLLNYMDITEASGSMQSSLDLLLAAVGLLLADRLRERSQSAISRMAARSREIAMRMAIRSRSASVDPATPHRERLACRSLAALWECAFLRHHPGHRGLDSSRLRSQRSAHRHQRLCPADFAVAVSMLTGISSGSCRHSAPRVPIVSDTLKDGGNGAGGSTRGQSARSGLVVVEICNVGCFACWCEL